MPASAELRRDDEIWAQRHAQLADLAVQAFLDTGRWPLRVDLQRDLDRNSLSDDVKSAAETIPILPGQQRPRFDEQFQLPLHVLRFVPAAEQLVEVSMALIGRVAALYLSEAELPSLKSSDPAVEAKADPLLARRAVDVVRQSQPQPLGSGNTGESYWSYEIDGQVARELTETLTIDEYVHRQIQICEGQITAQGTRTMRSRLARIVHDPVHKAGIYALVAALIGGGFLIYTTRPSSHSDESGTSSGSPNTSASSGAAQSNVDSSWLNSSNLCSWRLGTNHVPVVSNNPLQLRIDDRCNDPKQADPKKDTPTSVYASSSRDSGKVGEIADGYLITVRCYDSQGDDTSDAIGNQSSIWLGIDAPHGFIPNVDIGGGFTAPNSGRTAFDGAEWPASRAWTSSPSNALPGARD